VNALARIITVGHGTTPATDFAALLHQAGVVELVDVRTAPGSRRNPQFAKSEMERWLPEQNIGYRWDKRLGGWRKVEPDSPDTAVRHSSFRAYAGHMRTAEFRAGITDLLELAQQVQQQATQQRNDEGPSPEPDSAAGAPATESPNPAVAIMCSETVWWRCHRRMIADYLVLARDIPVHNLMPGGKLPAHSPMPAARLAAGPHGPELIYDVPDDPA